jgi:hypothetical protein
MCDSTKGERDTKKQREINEERERNELGAERRMRNGAAAYMQKSADP